MTIKQHGGIFGRNPTFNNVTVGGTLTVDQIVEKTGAAGITLDGVTLKDGNVVLADGKGIDFSATAGTGTSELFDDYEEGTWTPVYTTTGTDFDSVTYDPLTAGRYVKIGNVVHISGYIRTDALDATSATGTVVVSGLPFATAVVNSDTKSMGAIATSRALNFNGMSGYPFLHPRSGCSYMYLLDGDRIDVPVAEMSTGANTNIIAFAGTYTTE